MIDAGGLQVMGKRQKQEDTVRYGHGRRKLRDEEDTLDNIADVGNIPSGPGFVPTTLREETDLKEQEAAAMDKWRPPSEDSQIRLASLASRLGY